MGLLGGVGFAPSPWLALEELAAVWDRPPKHAGARRSLQVRAEGWNRAGLTSPRLATVVDRHSNVGAQLLLATRSLVCVDAALLRKQKFDRLLETVRSADAKY